jgi:signal transduction histidine kinase
MESWLLLQTHSVIAFICVVAQIAMIWFLFKGRGDVPIRFWLLINYFASAVWYTDQMFRFSLYENSEGSWLYKFETGIIYPCMIILQMLANYHIFYLFIHPMFDKERKWITRLFIPFSVFLFGVFFWNEYFNSSNIVVFQRASFIWGLLSYLLNISISIRKMLIFRHTDRNAFYAHVWLTVASLYFIILSIICLFFGLYTPIGYWTYFILILLGEITLIIAYLSYSAVFISFQVKITAYSFISVAFFLTIFTLLFFPPTMPNQLEIRLSQQSGLKKVFLLLFAATIGIVWLLPKLLRRTLTNPLKRLLLAVKEVNLGNLNVNVPIFFSDEIGSLTNNFNLMTGTIRESKERLEEYSKILRELYKNQQKVQEETLNHVSQEIHDNVGQLLSLVKMQLNLAVEREGSESQLLSDAQENIGRAMMDLRDLAKGMSSDRIKVLGLFGSVEQEANRIKRTGVCEVYTNCSGTIQSLDYQNEIILFRVIQECLQNIFKHARANRIDISFTYQPNHLTIGVQDNGKGFVVNANGNSIGLGLMNMQNRVRLIGGTLVLDSREGHGTRVSIDVPLL